MEQLITDLDAVQYTDTYGHAQLLLTDLGVGGSYRGRPAGDASCVAVDNATRAGEPMQISMVWIGGGARGNGKGRPAPMQMGRWYYI